MTGLIDSHCHLDMLAQWGRPDEAPDPGAAREAILGALDRARAAGVELVLNPGNSWKDLDRVMDVGESHPEVFVAAGIHPHEASTWEGDSAQRLRSYLIRPRTLALGECGLDYHYTHSPVDRQQVAFRAQIRLARELAKPLIVHTREAEADTMAILREEHADEVGGVLHCFTSSAWLAQEAMAIGFYISFSGAITFNKAHEVREVARLVPLDRLLIETDAPFLAPVPHRGKCNEPAFVVRVAEQLAELHGVSPEVIARRSAANTRKLFGIRSPSPQVSSK